jgi:hypothetical protein
MQGPGFSHACPRSRMHAGSKPSEAPRGARCRRRGAPRGGTLLSASTFQRAGGPSREQRLGAVARRDGEDVGVALGGEELGIVLALGWGVGGGGVWSRQGEARAHPGSRPGCCAVAVPPALGPAPGTPPARPGPPLLPPPPPPPSPAQCPPAAAARAQTSKPQTAQGRAPWRGGAGGAQAGSRLGRSTAIWLRRPAPPPPLTTATPHNPPCPAHSRNLSVSSRSSRAAHSPVTRAPSRVAAPWRAHCHSWLREISAVAASSIRLWMGTHPTPRSHDSM